MKLDSVRLRIVVLILTALTTVTTIASLATPFIAQISADVSTGSSKYNVGFLNGDHADGNLVFNYNWCSDCNGLNQTWLGMSILWGVPIALQVAAALLVFFSPNRAYWVLQLSFIVQACGGFGFCARVLPLFREVLQNTPQPINVYWTIAPAGVVAIIAICFHFLTLLAFAVFYRAFLVESMPIEANDESTSAHETNEPAS